MAPSVYAPLAFYWFNAWERWVTGHGGWQKQSSISQQFCQKQKLKLFPSVSHFRKGLLILLRVKNRFYCCVSFEFSIWKKAKLFSEQSTPQYKSTWLSFWITSVKVQCYTVCCNATKICLIRWQCWPCKVLHFKNSEWHQSEWMSLLRSSQSLWPQLLFMSFVWEWQPISSINGRFITLFQTVLWTDSVMNWGARPRPSVR